MTRSARLNERLVDISGLSMYNTSHQVKKRETNMNSNLTIITYKSGKSWWAYYIDSEGYQIGDAVSGPTKKLVIRYLKMEYPDYA